jgi:MazG family protein
MPAETAHFSDLLDLVRRLRAPDGCPWDREQTPAGMRSHFLEECYELVDAVNSGRPEAILEELGDVLFIVVFLSVIYEEQEAFPVADMIAANVAKMRGRHPHVFGETQAADVDAVLRNWEALKAAETKNRDRQSILDGIPEGLPALLYALSIQRKAARVGFDWEKTAQVLDKLREETAELEAELPDGDPERLEDEIGDLLFTVANLARRLEVDPESALRRSAQKFAERFRNVEKGMKEDARDWKGTTAAELDARWERAKEACDPR